MSGGAAAKHLRRWLPVRAAVVIAGLLLLAAWAAFSRVLIRPDLVLAFNDGSIESGLSPTFRLPDVIFRYWDNQFFFGQENGVLPPTVPNLLEVIFGPHSYRREGTWLGVWGVGLAGYWAIRQFRRSRLAALIAALLLMLCGWTLTSASVGLLVRGTSVAWAALSLGVLERNRAQDSWLGYAVAGGLLGLAVSDVPDVGLLLALSCGTYFLCAHWLVDATSHDWRTRRLVAFGVYVLACLGVAWPMLHTVAPSIQGQVLAGGDSDDELAWATQWSLPPQETWSLIAIDYHGASIRSRSAPYWGTMGQSPGWTRTGHGYPNFRLQGYAVGVVPVILLTILYVYLVSFRSSALLEPDCARVILPLTGIAIAALLLSWGNYFLLYRCFYALPFMSSMRNPEKWLGPFSLCIAVCLAYAVDLVRAMGSRGDLALNRNLLVRSGTVLAAIPLVAVLVLATANSASFADRLLHLRIADERVEAAWAHAQWSNIQAFVATLSGFGLLWYLLVRRRTSVPHPGTLAVGLLGCLMVAELLKAATPYVAGYSYAHTLQPTLLTTKLDAVRHRGRLKLLPPRHPILNDWRLTYLAIKGYELFDPVSVRRLPADYAWLFQESEEDAMCLWELGAVRYFLAPREVALQLAELRPTRGAFVVREERSANEWDPNLGAFNDQFCLVEFTAAMPLFQLVTASATFDPNRMDPAGIRRQLCSPEFNPRERVFLDNPAGQEWPLPQDASLAAASAAPTVQITRNEATFAEVIVDTATRAVLVRSVKYNRDWRVTIDDQPSGYGLLRANGFFQGVVIPAGHHTVSFEYRPSLTPLISYVAGRIGLAVCILVYSAHVWKSTH